MMKTDTLFLFLTGTLFAVLIAVATFIENELGNYVAREYIYNNLWFNLLEVVIGAFFIYYILKYRMYKKNLFSFLIHLSFVLLLIGAGVTSYFGMSASLHLRIGESKAQAVKELDNYPLPFSLRLDKFEVKRYPGTDTPSSYDSYVSLYEQGEKVAEFHIYMNHILSYKGYKVYQTSYDLDEKGSLFTVTNDPGMGITYVGYSLLFFALLANMFTKRSRFFTLFKRLKALEKEKTLLSLFLFSLLPFSLYSSEMTNDKLINTFAKTPVMYNGRIQPFHTLSKQVMQKIMKQRSYKGLHHDALFLSILAFPEEWDKEPIIYLTQSVKNFLQEKESRISFKALFDQKGGYKLQEALNKAMKTPDLKKSRFDREVIAVNERINVYFLITNGYFLSLFPVQKERWVSPYALESDTQVNEETRALIYGYTKRLMLSLRHHKEAEATAVFEMIQTLQKEVSPEIVPESYRVEMEILYNSFPFFTYIMIAAAILGMWILGHAFVSVFTPVTKKVFLAYGVLTGVLFIIYLTVFSMRAYISGFMPLSNGYESMIAVGLSSLIAGLLFRDNLFALSGALLVTSIVLLVAYLNGINPHITTLVPVLNSCWLSIHVSVIIASYGFLLLSALIGFIVLFLFVFMEGRKGALIIEELTLINKINVFIGLALLTIGTFLGGIWANESWGAYWSWDVKEAWSLISIIFYALLSHLTLLSKIKNYTYNLLSTVGFFVVLMTYAGVNIYFAGLHSYAKGEAVALPFWLYLLVGLIISLALLGFKKRELLEYGIKNRLL